MKTDRQVVFLSEAKKIEVRSKPLLFWPIHRKNSQLPSGKYIFFLEIYEGKLFACLRRYACSRDLNARLRFPSSALSISADGGNYRLFCTSESSSAAAARVGPLVPTTREAFGLLGMLVVGRPPPPLPSLHPKNSYSAAAVEAREGEKFLRLPS